jgi:Amt family ammonium transporter
LMLVPLTNDGATFGAQALGLAAIFIWTFGASLVVWFIIKMIMGIRVTEEEEYEGVDISECGIEAYPEFASRS